jgi:autotransporter strand-loop-strand O-heptosyltransferase
MNVNKDIQMILDNFNVIKKDEDISYLDKLNSEYNDNIESNDKSESNVDYRINFVDGAKVEILSDDKLEFGVEFLDKNTNDIIYKTAISTNSWCATNIKYYKEYKVNITYNNEIVVSHNFDLTNKNVLIKFDSSSIGDSIAWIPYVEEFRKKHNCKVYCSTFMNHLFEKQYKDIVFLKPGSEDIIDKLYARYNIGWYMPYDQNKNPIDFKKIPLQKAASDILGLEYKEIGPNINMPDGIRPIKDKYVCIAQFSTANSKHWHYPSIDSNKGWQILVDWLNAQGYKVMVISKQPTNLENVINMTGDFPLEHRINQLKWCEFFIGIGSGLSWLAWAIGKKVVMISGFSNPICEFQSNNINVHNFNVCNGCFNRHEFDRGDWNWCPEHKNTDRQFECTINITPEMVISRIISAKLIEEEKTFDLNLYNNDIKLDINDINISYDKNENKFNISYKNEKTPKLNIRIRDYKSDKIFHVISDISLSKEYNIWCVPGTNVYSETNKVLISFYEKNKILDIEYIL